MTTVRGHSPPPVFDAWLQALEERHLANLRIPEVTRALRALSSVYVERRHEGVLHKALDSAGKRAAFALFYGPLHFITTYAIVQAIGPGAVGSSAGARRILDLGCGTGAAGAAWALSAGTAADTAADAAAGTTAGTAAITGLDRHPWAVAEARWTYDALGLRGSARRDDLTRMPPIGAGDAVLAAFLLNELADPAHVALFRRLLEGARRGAQVLVIEPISLRVSPWWRDAASEVEAAGGRADEWRFAVDLPERVRLLDKAAGLDHRELTARSLYCPGSGGG